MSSIIVLDSSDEDESPPKKANLKSTLDSSSALNAAISKTQQSKQRSIPSSITVTPRPPQLPGANKNSNNITMQQHITTPMAASLNQAITNMLNQQQQERQTPTPPNKGQTGNFMHNPRKRKTPTPPATAMQQRLAAKTFATMAHNSSPAKAATTIAPLPPIMPMITGVHSISAAGATPPLQLMATPPHHNMAGFMGLNEQLMINPHLIPAANLPPNTTITPHPNSNPNQNNINNNFKIHLPLKPSPMTTTTTPSPAASPASSAPKTPSPQLAASPQPQHGGGGASVRTDKGSRRIKPTTVLKSSDDAWLQQRHKSSAQRPPISLNNDVVIEMLPPSSTESPKSLSSSASSSRHHTPMTSPTTTPKSQKSPDVIMVTPPISTHNNNNTNVATDMGGVLDLTHSPKKMDPNEIVDLSGTPQRKQCNGNDNDKSIKSSTEINSTTNGKTPESKPEKPPPKPPLEPEYEELIKTCREADPSPDMEKLIKSKLLKYYYDVHGDFVKSKSFRKSIRKVVATIKAEPKLVYYNLKTIVEELKVRRKAKIVEQVVEEEEPPMVMPIKEEVIVIKEEATAVKETPKTADTPNTSAAAAESAPASSSSAPASISATATTSTGNKKTDEQIKKLNKALYVLTKRIEVLEQSDVDWNDDDSSYLQVERFKKRACQIYEKICDLTGESKNAHRLVKKPIKFNETRIPQFNKTLQAFINRTKEFPDYYDVLRMLEHCNRTYNLGLVNFEIKNIAEEAFIKVGKLLQSRRKADLYETVTHYGGSAKDPAKTDPELAAKLNENLKNHKKINEILEKFSRKQDMPDEEEEDKAESSQNTENNSPETIEEVKTGKETDAIDPEKESRGDDAEVKIKVEVEDKKEVKMEVIKKEAVNETVEIDDDDDDEDDEEEDEEDLEQHVETLANGDISDNESDNELNDTSKKPQVVCSTTNKELILDKNNEIPINDTKSKEFIENKLDKSVGEVSTNNDTSMEYIEILNKSNDVAINKNNSMDCIEIQDNSQEDIMEVDPPSNQATTNTIIQIDPQTQSICLNNNNNNDVEATTKTVLSTTAEELKSGNLTPPPPNGKFKDTSELNNEVIPLSPSCTAATIAAASSATTTTTKADLKIVHVSSLDHSEHNTIEDSSFCTELTTTPSGNRSLEEIVISDEDS